MPCLLFCDQKNVKNGVLKLNEAKKNDVNINHDVARSDAIFMSILHIRLAVHFTFVRSESIECRLRATFRQH